MTKRVTMLAFDGVNLLDIAGPLQVLGSAVDPAGDTKPPYEIRIVSERGGPVSTGVGVLLHTLPFSALADEQVGVLMAPGGFDTEPLFSAPLLDFIRAKAPGADRVCSVCTGAFSLAEAGLLDGRRTATHWRFVDTFRQRYPKVQLDADAIFVRDGRWWGSAGVSAGIDLALALVEDDLGHAASIAVARQLVVYLKRDGGQSQFSAPLAIQAASSSVFSDLVAWISSHLEGDLSLDPLAKRCNMSKRAFSRSYLAQVGETPASTVRKMRLEAARLALEAGPSSLKRIATDTGFGDDQNLRRAFVKRFGVTPQAYRDRFAVRR